MITIQSFTFNPFQENTYVAFDETLECIIVDPGCYDAKDNAVLSKFIEENKLKPVALVNTHCHLDHLFGNKFVSDTYQLEPIMHEADLPLLEYAPLTAIQYDLQLDELPEVGKFVEEGDVIHFGNSSSEVLFTPGHAPGHICLLNRDEKIILSADVLFHLSIGRTDLPLGDHATLLKSIKEKLLVLEEDVVVYPGHGPNTSIGFEKKNNPFLQ